MGGARAWRPGVRRGPTRTTLRCRVRHQGEGAAHADERDLVGCRSERSRRDGRASLGRRWRVHRRGARIDALRLERRRCHVSNVRADAGAPYRERLRAFRRRHRRHGRDTDAARPRRRPPASSTRAAEERRPRGRHARRAAPSRRASDTGERGRRTPLHDAHVPANGDLSRGDVAHRRTRGAPKGGRRRATPSGPPFPHCHEMAAGSKGQRSLHARRGGRRPFGRPSLGRRRVPLARRRRTRRRRRGPTPSGPSMDPERSRRPRSTIIVGIHGRSTALCRRAFAASSVPKSLRHDGSMVSSPMESAREVGAPRVPPSSRCSARRRSRSTTRSSTELRSRSRPPTAIPFA